MITPTYACPHCQAAKTGPHGFNRSGSRRYRCASCRRHFTPQPKPQSPYSDDFKYQVVRHYLEGQGQRSVARLHGLVHQTVANWANQLADALPEPVDALDPATGQADLTAVNAPAPTTPNPPAREIVVEVDELYSFIGEKKSKSTSLWRWNAIVG